MKCFQQLLLCGSLLALSGCDAPEPSAGKHADASPTVPVDDCELVMGWDPWAPYQY